MRIKHPSMLRSSMRASCGFSGFVLPQPVPTREDPNHVYGQPMRPGTPIKAVLGNLYGEVAAYQKQKYHQRLEFSDSKLQERMVNPPRNHTRASLAASTFINENNIRNLKQFDDSKSLFKMHKFLLVKPKLDTINHGYKPANRRVQPKSQIRT